MDNQLQIN